MLSPLPRTSKQRSAAILALALLAKAGPVAAAGEAALTAPGMVRALQAGEVFDVPDTKFTRSWVLGAFQVFNEKCQPLPGENSQWLTQQAIRYMDRRLYDETRTQMAAVASSMRPSGQHAVPSLDGRFDADALLRRAGGCDSVPVQQLRKGLHTVISDRASASPASDERLDTVAHLLDPQVAQSLGAKVRAKPAPSGARTLVVCWRGQVQMSAEERARHNPKTDGPLPVSADLPEYVTLRTRLADEAKKTTGSAQRVAQAGLFPVAFVELPNDWAWKHAVAYHGAGSALEQDCRFAGYVKHVVVLQ